ncbi:MAG TPA: sigma-70 family RNA polymerase sigma factor [Pyrinomonadaceae bacterium]|nr:sigma-70 family RNA polymerase sigma factor [Pyrinomonadaceae bacterium]
MAENGEKHDVTELLLAWNKGEKEAIEKLFPLVYRELKKIAKRYFRRERDDHTLQTTALVHEAYFKLIDQTRIKWQNRAHFFGIAAQAMRRILLEHARQHIADKRGSGNPNISLDAEEIDISQERATELIMLDEALRKLEAIDPERSKLVELRYFGGLSIEETAQVLGVGTATVNRSWRVAKAWLYKELSDL